MNKDQVKGATKDVIGKVQQEAGKLVGSIRSSPVDRFADDDMVPRD